MWATGINNAARFCDQNAPEREFVVVDPKGCVAFTIAVGGEGGCEWWMMIIAECAEFGVLETYQQARNIIYTCIKYSKCSPD